MTTLSLFAGNVDLYINEKHDPHVLQVLTGFFLLEQRKILRIRLRCQSELGFIFKRSENEHLLQKKRSLVMAVFNNAHLVTYDLHDSHEIEKELRDQSDVYFKRSFNPDLTPPELLLENRVQPLGFNYLVRPNAISLKWLGFYLRKDFKTFLTLLRNYTLHSRHYSRLSEMHEEPNNKIPPNILFMARAWDPSEAGESISRDKARERLEINEMRSAVVIGLRQEFGSNFFGGLEPNEYARKNHPAALLSSESFSRKSNYISLLRKHSICVATSGLHRSNGWKLAEYVAFSRAIVSESLFASVPGDFKKNSNYLEFRSVDEALEKCAFLFTDSDARHAMMLRNFDYYNKYLRPDLLILNSIAAAIR